MQTVIGQAYGRTEARGPHALDGAFGASRVIEHKNEEWPRVAGFVVQAPESYAEKPVHSIWTADTNDNFES